ncbi:hypothetical protein HK104_000703 [Borealophlyctis nickersoniae]|nr:hypothetical protein HK104_000703 [Borealophlyctis nickersoniae]
MVEWPDKVAIIIEPRPVANLVPIILHFESILAPDWHFHIFHSPANTHLLLNSRGLDIHFRAGRITMTVLPYEVKIDSGPSLSYLLTKPWFWEQIEQEYVLFFQADTILCANSDLKPEDFFTYGWVGAPWFWDDWGGNGGLSLRKRSLMLEITRLHEWTENDIPDFPEKPAPEDVWFVHHMKKIPGTVVAHRNVSRAFSVEHVFFPRPMGMHQPWVRLDRTPETDFALFQWCPEVALTGWNPMLAYGPVKFEELIL